MPQERYDLAVIGGGINGAGIARDATGRGLSVLLAEQGDLAGATSSASTKLIHGGLRYLEQFEFRLVSEALVEREALLGIAPHIVWPQEFVLPHEPHLRPAWMLRAGLFLYDHLGRGAFALRGGRSSLPRSKPVVLASGDYGAGLKPEFIRGFSYFDCWVDDARLVVLNARSAAQRGAVIRTRTRVTRASREGDGWRVELQGPAALDTRAVQARVLVNAAGPWVRRVIDDVLEETSAAGVRLVRGSHIVVPRLHQRRHAYILQNPDRRIIFMIPYEREFTLIGTTDIALKDFTSPADGGSTASAEEIAYLCESANRYSAATIYPGQVVWSYSGVRALHDDGSNNPSAVTRDYHLQLDRGDGGKGAPVLSVFGGKITTYRRLAEHALEMLADWFPGTKAWTHSEPLPGGNLQGSDPAAGFAHLLEGLQSRYPAFPVTFLARLARRHGTLVPDILGEAQSPEDLGENFGGGLHEAEVRYLVAYEWAREADDVLWRRTKCGLHMSEDERQRLAEALRAML
jgi:glycerol-3-phosphate dehydrogenase